MVGQFCVQTRENKIDYTIEFKYRYGNTLRTGNFTF